MAIAGQEITRPLTIPLSQDQRDRLEQAAARAGQSLDDFAASALLRAAENALSPPAVLSTGSDPLDRVAGIFKDEPLMDDLMERIREDRRVEIEAIEAEIEAEARNAGASG